MCRETQKKRERERETVVQGELFVEAQCWSNRPAFCLVDVDAEQEKFHLYSAMGLPHQHAEVSTLLARIRRASVARKWVRLLCDHTPCSHRRGQFKMTDESLCRIFAPGWKAVRKNCSAASGATASNWGSEQHTPERTGTFGALRGARNAVAGAVAHPVGGFLDFLTAASRGWTEQPSIASQRPADSQACLVFWPLRGSPDSSPAKYYQCCQAPPLDAILFWSPRCELVCLDGEATLPEPNLRLLPAGVLLTTQQLHVLVDGDTAVLKLPELRAVEATEPCLGCSPSGWWGIHGDPW
eukprot:Skav222487  [mRNA]  locus=scaffold1835:10567:23212:+ [translate_table: standard]